MAQCVSIIPLSLWRKWTMCGLRSGWPTATQIVYDLIFYWTPSSHPRLSHCLLLAHAQSVKAALLRSTISLWATTDSSLWQNACETPGKPQYQRMSLPNVCCFPWSRYAKPHRSTKTANALCLKQERNASSSIPTYRSFWRRSDGSQRYCSRA